MTQQRKLQIAIGLFGLAMVAVGVSVWRAMPSRNHAAEDGQQKILDQMAAEKPTTDPTPEEAAPQPPKDPDAPARGLPRSAKPGK